MTEEDMRLLMPRGQIWLANLMDGIASIDAQNATGNLTPQRCPVDLEAVLNTPPRGGLAGTADAEVVLFLFLAQIHQLYCVAQRRRS
jgi:hypothetical protein